MQSDEEILDGFEDPENGKTRFPLGIKIDLEQLKWIEEEQSYQPYCEDMKGLKEVDAIGSGCFLVARRVISKLRDQQPFMRQWNQDGTVEVGGDYSFCQKVKKAGFKVWAHFSYPCHHFNEVSLIEVIEAMNAMEK